VNVADGIGWRRQNILAAGKKFHALAVGELQEHQLRPLAARRHAVNHLGVESVVIPANAALHVGDFECDVSETKSCDAHKFSFDDTLLYSNQKFWKSRSAAGLD